MKKAYDAIDNKRHSELVSESQETLKQVQGDGGVVQGDKKQIQGGRIKAFTLAEIMIVLSVIAVLTAILLPAARNAAPNEDILKFKKAHNTLTGAIKELIYSNMYYLNGDLGLRPDGSRLRSSEAQDRKYFCQTLADVMTTKEANCTDFESALRGAAITNNDGAIIQSIAEFRDSSSNGQAVTNESISYSKNNLDMHCKYNVSSNYYKQIILEDGVWIYDNAPAMTFGMTASETSSSRYFSAPNQNPATFHDDNGFDTIYKVVCIDIDGIPANATRNNCINECPFGYGIRADGKILNGARVEEWLNKSIQEKD